MQWTLAELVARGRDADRGAAAPKNGQVRAVPDERTIRYYGAIGLLDRPAAMRGRTALYGARHLAQVVAIKRLQGAGGASPRSRTLWPTLDDATLARMSGVAARAAAARPRASSGSAQPHRALHQRRPRQPAPVPRSRPRRSSFASSSRRTSL